MATIDHIKIDCSGNLLVGLMHISLESLLDVHYLQIMYMQ